MNIDNFLVTMEVRLNKCYTEEQRDFIKNLDTPGICFASPGTGKTASAVAGLLLTELYKQIPGNKIYALSFTNAATLELSVRHKEACSRLGINQNVNFKTLHSMCTNILRENHELLGMENLRISSSFSIESLSRIIMSACQERNIEIDPRNIRNIVKAVRTLNSSLTFEKHNVESKMCFIETRLKYEDFTFIRKLLYDYNKLAERIQVDDIMLYTLELLLKHPEVSRKFKDQCRVMLVDEAQDLSLLQLRIISLLTDCPVLIGDIKQQIYAFNGACQEIVGQFYKYFPGAWRKYFSRSFRCKNEIANYATKLILPNHVGGEDFTGTGDGGVVTVGTGIDYDTICKEISDKFLMNRRNFEKGILFLFRNNASALPVSEAFFKWKCPFRVNNYTPVQSLPVIKDLCDFVNLATNPGILENVACLPKLIPEFRAYESYTDIPIYRIMKQKHIGLFDVNYKFKNEFNGEHVMQLLLEVHDMAVGGALASELFNKLYPTYYQVWLQERERYLEYDAKYYLRLANPIIQGKTYPALIKNEIEKMKFIDECNARRIGVRCYTFHSAKGLEDDIVYMVDCDQDIIPNASKLDRMVRFNCDLDAAREIRNERSLVYVAATRAKEELHVYYNGEISKLLEGENPYLKYDMLYENFKIDYRDVEVFQEFCKEED